MSRRTAVHWHPTFGPVPRWTTLRPVTLTIFIVYCGMGLGLGVLEPAWAPFPFGDVARLLPVWAKALAIIALTLGALFGSLFFGAIALFQHQSERALNSSAQDCLADDSETNRA